jgi:5,10-methylenetetrahydromethanopterin reductase
LKRIGFGLIGNLPIRTTIELVQSAERCGFESFWMHESYFYRDALSYLSALSLSTSTIKLAAGCINPYTRHPVLIAMTMSGLEELCTGRMILGLGTGFLTRLDQMGIAHENPARHLEESISIIRRLLRGESVSYQGLHYSLRDLKPFFPKIERGIPIYLPGWRRRMIELAGKVADGYLARATESLQSLTVLSETLKTACESHGRDPSKLDMAAYILCSAKKTEEAAREAMRRNPFTIYQFAVIDDYVLSQSGFDPAHKKKIAEPYWKGALSSASKEISDELLDAFTAVGTSDGVIDKIEAFSKIAMPILQPIGADVGDANLVLDAGRAFAQE